MKGSRNSLENFILNTLTEENSLNIQFVTKEDISSLVRLIETRA